MRTSRKYRRYRNYFIHLVVQPLADGSFIYEGFIRKPDPYGVGAGLPFKSSFKSGEKFSTEEAAMRAGFEAGKMKIDSVDGLTLKR